MPTTRATELAQVGSLGRMPYEAVFALIEKIQAQAKDQVSDKKES